MTNIDVQPIPPSTERTAADLRSLRENWGDLLATRLYGPPRARSKGEQELTDDQRAERDALARAERAERDADCPGWSPAPLRLDVVEVIADVTAGVLELEDAVRETLGFGPAVRPAQNSAIRLAYDAHRNLAEAEEPDGSVHWACVWLEDALPAIRDHEVLAEHVTAEVRRMAQAVRAVIGYAASSVLIKVPCFVCRGVDELHPTGTRTLRLYSEGRLVDAYVLCHNPRCLPSPEQCGSRRHGRPMWTSDELVWLNGKLEEGTGQDSDEHMFDRVLLHAA